MHILVVWQILDTGPRRSTIDTELREVIGSFSFVSPFPATFVLKISSETDRESIHARLSEVIKRFEYKVWLIITPAMVGGRYQGWLGEGLWEPINERTDK